MFPFLVFALHLAGAGIQNRAGGEWGVSTADTPSTLDSLSFCYPSGDSTVLALKLTTSGATVVLLLHCSCEMLSFLKYIPWADRCVVIL